MENQNEKIANLQLIFKDDCSELHREILELYWQLDELDIANSVKSIRNKFNITQNELTKIYQKAALEFYVLCEGCNSFEKNTANSHSRFREELRKTKHSSYKPFKCDYCLENELREKQKEELQKRQQLIRQLNSAIENKNWNNLSKFEKGVLKNSLGMNFYNLKKHYGKILGRDKFITLIRALEKIENQNLIIIERDFKNYIEDIRYLERLKDFKNKIIVQVDNNTSKVEQNIETGELKFKLIVNNEKHHPYSPIHSGTVTFKKKIILEPNVEYVFAQWERANNNLYLTMIPTSEFEKFPIQKPISKLPKHIKKGVHEFLKNIGGNIDF